MVSKYRKIRTSEFCFGVEDFWSSPRCIVKGFLVGIPSDFRKSLSGRDSKELGNECLVSLVLNVPSHEIVSFLNWIRRFIPI